LLCAGNNAAELAGFVVEMTFRYDPLGSLERADDFWIVGRLLEI